MPDGQTDLADLKGRTALVTGAGDVGSEIALRLARHGAGQVAVVDLDAARAEKVAGQIKAAGARGIPLVADLTNPDEVSRLPRAIEEAGATVDILVNNAGMPPNFYEQGKGRSPFVESDPGDWAPLLDLNLDAVLRMTHAFVPQMIEREFGRVITIVSDSARVGDRNMAIYAAAKGGASAFMRSLASEVGPFGITANCVSLGTIWRSPEPPEGRVAKAAERLYPLGRYGEVEDVSSMVTFLASDAAKWITGQVYGVNGGYTYGL
ncbi:MAG: SDR family NAD(P)-dependent oxidoreductase [Myxococcota bacterium]